MAPLCVNFLDWDHECLALAFGGNGPTEQRFRRELANSIRGAAYLTDAQANLFCVIDGQAQLRHTHYLRGSAEMQ